MSVKPEDTTQPQAIDELKAKYGKVYQLDLSLTPDDDTEIELSYIFKRPSAPSFGRYTKEMGNNFVKATNTFLRDNVIPEQLARLEADLEKYPALGMSLSDKLLTMLGLSKSANLKLL